MGDGRQGGHRDDGPQRRAGLPGDGYDKAKQILTEQRAKMDAVVERLKVDETIDAGELDEILACVIGPTVPDPESASVTTHEFPVFPVSSERE